MTCDDEGKNSNRITKASKISLTLENYIKVFASSPSEKKKKLWLFLKVVLCMQRDGGGVALWTKTLILSENLGFF